MVVGKDVIRENGIAHGYFSTAGSSLRQRIPLLITKENSLLIIFIAIYIK